MTSSFLHLGATETPSLVSKQAPKILKSRPEAARVYVVVYPSNSTSTKFLPDAGEKKLQGYGFGICVEPRKRSRAKFWSDKDSGTILVTVEDYGEDELTLRSGPDVASSGMLLRVVIGEMDESADPSRYVACLAPLVKAGAQKADAAWMTSCIKALQASGLVACFDVADFRRTMDVLLQAQLSVDTTGSLSGKTVNYLDL